MKKYEINTEKELTQVEIEELEKIFNCTFIVINNDDNSNGKLTQ